MPVIMPKGRCLPDYRGAHESVVIPPFCRDQGIQAVIFDLDGTLRAHVFRRLWASARGNLDRLTYDGIPWAVVSKSLPWLVKRVFPREEDDGRLITCGPLTAHPRKSDGMKAAMRYLGTKGVDPGARVLCVGDYYADVLAASEVAAEYPGVCAMLLDPARGASFWMRRRYLEDQRLIEQMLHDGEVFPPVITER